MGSHCRSCGAEAIYFVSEEQAICVVIKEEHLYAAFRDSWLHEHILYPTGKLAGTPLNPTLPAHLEKKLEVRSWKIPEEITIYVSDSAGMGARQWQKLVSGVRELGPRLLAGH